MSTFDFVAIPCRTCNRVIWTGVASTGIAVKLDTARLNLAQEIMAKLDGRRTYQIHQSLASFEATPRLGARLGFGGAVVLATHVCSWQDFDYGSAPDYFGKQTYEPKEVEF